ncbi:MAG: thioredoxin [Candidatus Abyssobacteria bacterium SURF_17]|jgi:hypothetical protein|uniref:Thioredoxin n=1 Tax=Candidatus Abyssobacteria bacterium SURF_17 TaxID=2093361 RepID=A0A419ERQ5_9BACT|nr:MAG: thioredoxin [Candidatus Abyssubacteria bacterium SURF_17]
MRTVFENLKKRLWLIMLIAALALGGFGIYRGEAVEVFEKARAVCLECIGIG